MKVKFRHLRYLHRLLKCRRTDQAYRVRSRFLASRQGKRTLGEFAHDLRVLIVATVCEPVAEAVQTTNFMEGLCLGVARTEVFRARPPTFKEAVKVAQIAKFNLQSARLGVRGAYPRSSSSSLHDNEPEPMDLSHAESTEAELRAVEQRRGIRRCYRYEDPNHLRPDCPLCRSRKAPMSRGPGPHLKPGMGRENVEPQ